MIVVVKELVENLILIRNIFKKNFIKRLREREFIGDIVHMQVYSDNPTEQAQKFTFTNSGYFQACEEDFNSFLICSENSACQL